MKAQEFAKALQDLRADRDLTQKQVADGLGIAVSVYGHYEQGRTQPDIETIAKICEFYQISADLLLGIPKREKDLNRLVYQVRELPPDDRNKVAEYAELLYFRFKSKTAPK